MLNLEKKVFDNRFNGSALSQETIIIYQKRDNNSLVSLMCKEQISIVHDVSGRIYGILVQFGCYQLRYAWKGLCNYLVCKLIIIIIHKIYQSGEPGLL